VRAITTRAALTACLLGCGDYQLTGRLIDAEGDDTSAHSPDETGTAAGDTSTGEHTTEPDPCDYGRDAECPGRDCLDIQQKTAATEDGTYWIAPLAEPPYPVHCLMAPAFDGGGWTLLAVTSDDGQHTWTWAGRHYWDTDTTTFGDLSTLHRDYKSQALHEVRAEDLLFWHHPSGTWAVYGGVGSPQDTLESIVSGVGEDHCWDGTDGHDMTAGTLTTSERLCSTQLYFNASDQEGSYGCDSCGSYCADTYGPSWSTGGNDGCIFDDPGQTGSLGPYRSEPDREGGSYSYGGATIELYPIGFGWALELNTGASGSGENAMWVAVR